MKYYNLWNDRDILCNLSAHRSDVFLRCDSMQTMQRFRLLSAIIDILLTNIVRMDRYHQPILPVKAFLYIY